MKRMLQSEIGVFSGQLCGQELVVREGVRGIDGRETVNPG